MASASVMVPETSPPISALQQLLGSPNFSLRYTVARASSYSGTYHPNNILQNRPHDMYSRWSGSSQHAHAANPAQGPSANTASSSPSSGSTSSSTRRSVGANSSATSAVVANPATQLSSKQYIILKLEKPCVVRNITFGKYHKPHPCNLRDFKIYGSMSLESLLPSSNPSSRPPASKRLVRGGLRNDSTPETFELRWLEDVAAGSGFGSLLVGGFGTSQGELDRRAATAALVSNGNVIPFALQYIKIIPLAAHTPNYNFSVWHVALSGVSNTNLNSRVMAEYQDYRQSSTTRLILKHLREQGHHTAFSALLQSSQLGATPSPEVGSVAMKKTSNPTKRPFEHPLLTALFDSLVRQGAWDEAEACLDRAACGDLSSGLSTPASPFPQVASPTNNLAGSANWSSVSDQSMFSSYITKQMPKAQWNQILPQAHHVQQRDSSGQGTPLAPSGRGGHSMVFDSDKGIAYLFGGWDGKRDLSDLWAFHVHEDRWRLISNDVRLQGGPCPRSCHKMCLDEKSGCIYLLGRYIDYEGSMREPTLADSASPSTAARNTRANFLPHAPASSQLSHDFVMNLANASSQTGDVDPAADPTAVSRTRHRRLGELAASATGDDSRLRIPSAPSPVNSPRPTSRTVPASRSSSRNHFPVSSAPGRESDFFRFSTRSEKWERLSADTYADGGPKLIYDHGLVADPQNQMLYIFGGRVADPDPSKFEFSGMWRYDVIQRAWTFMFDDNTSTGGKILSRSGHSMLLDPGKPSASGISSSHSRQIWILGGQRGASATYLADMYTYNLATGAVREISRNTGQAGPESGFTQRATIDAAARDISLFVGLIGGKGERKRSAFWIYNIPRGSWRKVYQYESGSLMEDEDLDGGSMDVDHGVNTLGGRDAEGDFDGDGIPESGPLQALPSYSDGAESEDNMIIEGPPESWIAYGGDPLSSPRNVSQPGSEIGTSSLGASLHSTLPRQRPGGLSEPRPRYAAQMVYDDRRKVYYLHGGNPEDTENRSLRLDDLWKLMLLRPTPGEILRRAKFRVRHQRFLEMVREIASGQETSTTLGLEALMYLQSEVGAVVDHSNESESKIFRKLMSHLLSAKSTVATSSSEDTPIGADYGYRGSVISSGAKRGRDELDPEESVSSILSGDDEDSEMLSVSQVLPRSAKKNVLAGEAEGKPSSLYIERNRLFRGLLEYFNTELIEPRAEIGLCIESALGG